MSEIELCVPQLMGSGSYPEEYSLVRKALGSCLQSLTQGNAETHVVPTLRKTGKARVTFDLPSVFHARSSHAENAVALQTLLHCLCDMNAIFLQFRPGLVPPLYNSGVYYKRTNIWDTTAALYRRGFGDCKSLACALVAEYSVQGIPCAPVFRFLEMSSNRIFYHILVEVPWGYEDPSKVLGMSQDENSYFKAAA
jgi:hypothetical protein